MCIKHGSVFHSIQNKKASATDHRKTMADNHLSMIQLFCVLLLASAHFINAKNIDSSDGLDEPDTQFANGLSLEAMTDRQNGCYWDGTAPFCEGRCPNGFKEINSSKKGEGSFCWSGYKKYCCPK